MIPIKAMLISTGIAAIALFLNFYLPMAVEFSVSRAPILWSSFNSWLKPPYLLVLVNVIITIIVASSKYLDSFDEEDHSEIQTEPIVHLAPDVKEADLDFSVTFPPPISVTVVERSEAVCEEEKKEEISGVINGGDQVRSVIEDQEPSMIDESSENLPPAEKKPLVLGRSGHRKPVKSSGKGGGKRKKTFKVVKPKPTLENTWTSVMEELKSTPLTGRYRRTNSLGLDAGEVKPAALRKSVTFRDITNHQKSPVMVTPPPMKMKVKEEMVSPSDEELNRRVEAFIKKTKLERLESMRLDKRSLKRNV